MSEITYAKAGGPPEDWWNIHVVDVDTGQAVARVTEVNAAEGWLLRHKIDGHGELVTDGQRVVTERVEGRFQIRRKVG